MPRHTATFTAVAKNSSINGTQKFVVDIASKLPTILMVIDVDDNITFIQAKSNLMHGYDRIASTDLGSKEFWKEANNLTTFWNAGSLAW